METCHQLLLTLITILVLIVLVLIYKQVEIYLERNYQQNNLKNLENQSN